MTTTKSKKKMLLHKGIMICTFFAMTLFFSLINIQDVQAYKFKYSEFNWENFYEENKEFWLQGCITPEGKTDEECEYQILRLQKKFYTKFYKMLAKYEKQGILKPDSSLKEDREIYEYVDDIILETVFFEMTPSQFADNPEEYIATYNPKEGKGVYTIDETDLEDPKLDIDYTNEEALAYYEKETDTLKVLVRNLVAYTTDCYGIYGDPVEHKTSNGETYTDCEGVGGEKIETRTRGLKCADNIDNSSLGFWKYFVSKIQYDETLPWYQRGLTILFLGRNDVDENYTTCKSYDSTYPEGATYVYNDDPQINTDRYFDFLSYNTYFDSKVHLQEKYRTTILEPAGVDCMTSDVCDNSLEAAGLYSEYEGEAILIRRQIIEDIIIILNNYGFEIEYDPVTGNSYNEAEANTATRRSFYWPIGSDETEERNGVIYADKDPASTNVISKFGTRENPITGELEEHYGIDISGVDGVTNVIAVYRGEVVSVVDHCSVGDTTCNEGYGNTIIISHSNNDYTVYAHLSSIDPSVTIGSTVDKGQLIGKVGMTGMTKEACLHYELRKGGNDVLHAIDPLSEMSSSNPRPKVASGDFSVHETSLSKEEFASKLRAYCVSNKCSTDFMNIFVANAERVYEISVANNVNPELVVIRGAKEGMSPGGSTNNYWGIGCYNGAGSGACARYGSLEDGIRGFAKAVAGYDTVSQMMSKYAYIGAVWYNPGSWSLGGCKYFPYISKYMSEGRQATVSRVCNGGPSCTSKGQSSCTSTNDEDQNAYAMYNASSMVNMRYVAFGL